MKSFCPKNIPNEKKKTLKYYLLESELTMAFTAQIYCPLFSVSFLIVYAIAYQPTLFPMAMTYKQTNERPS